MLTVAFNDISHKANLRCAPQDKEAGASIIGAVIVLDDYSCKSSVVNVIAAHQDAVACVADRDAVPNNDVTDEAATVWL
jgi:hypothetical protein